MIQPMVEFFPVVKKPAATALPVPSSSGHALVPASSSSVRQSELVHPKTAFQAMLGRSQVRFGNQQERFEALDSLIFLFRNAVRTENFEDIPLSKIFQTMKEASDFNELIDTQLKEGSTAVKSTDKDLKATYQQIFQGLGINNARLQDHILIEFSKRNLVRSNSPAEASQAGTLNALTPDKQVYLSNFGQHVTNLWHQLPESAQLQAPKRLIMIGSKPIRPTSTPPKPLPESFKSFVTDMNVEALEGKYPPYIGRDAEYEMVERVFMKRFSHNVKIVGDAGIGKTAFVQGLAKRIVEGNVPDELKDKRILQVDLGSVVAGTMYRGQLEERVRQLVDYAKQNPDVILFIDEFHTVMKAGGAGEGGLNVGEQLKSFLGSSDSFAIVTTTDEENRKFVESNEALDRRFTTITFDPPGKAETLEILEGLVPVLKNHHDIEYPTEVLEKLTSLAHRYVINKHAPNREINIVDEASVLARRSGAKELTEEHVTSVISGHTGIPMTFFTEDASERLDNLEERLHERVIGQDEAIDAVAQAVRNLRSGLMGDDEPGGKFLFVGPTGVGKTELAKALTEIMTGNEANLTRIDMGQFTESHSVSRLIGSPPGYVGYNEGGELTEAIRRNPYGVILLDEIEKAHPEVYKHLFSLLDEGYIKDAQGRKADARHNIIIMTSNIGDNLYQEIKPMNLGFKTPNSSEELNQRHIMKVEQEQDKMIQQRFSTAFVNRLDGVIPFKKLTPEQYIQVMQLHLNKFERQVKEAKGIEISFSDAAYAFLAEQLEAGTHQQGGRKVEGLIKEEVLTPLVNAKAKSKSRQHADVVTDDNGKKRLVFTPVETEDKPVKATKKKKST